jgi:peroxiredoxin
MKKSTLFVILMLSSTIVFGQSKDEYLKKVLNNLNQIKSATYYSTSSASAPGDTITFSEPRTLFVKEFVNPADSFVGASYIQYKNTDTNKIDGFYDGVVKGEFDWDKQTVEIDSFKNYPYPFRIVYIPFYTRTTSIINYALTTKDNIKTVIKDLGDSVQFSLFVYDKSIEFVTKPYYYVSEEPGIAKISQYDIWIRKSDNLPCRMRRKMSHQTSFETCSDVRLNISQNMVFRSRDYFPKNFSVVLLKRGKKKYKSDLVGKTAPDWTLKGIDGNYIRLGDLTSKLLMIQFTGVGCGPCHQSLPFLKQLVSDYKDKNFEFVSIETWSNNIEGLKRYQQRNGFNFKFLKSEPSVTKSYNVTSVPTFFILDENRIIRKVLNGYGKGATDKVIRDTIDELLK